MTLPNHLAGGFVFTGVFSGICGINILESPELLVMTFVASTIADVDVPTSFWGRLLRPISRLINRRFGHRTLTHSLFFLLLLWGSVWLTTRLTGSQLPYPTVFFFGFSSHLIFDMMTVQGVLLLYPYSKSPCVIPADPNLRLKTNNPGSELAVFGFFVLSGLFLQPLMADGFWTSYNRLFGTLEHLRSEFEKSEDLLSVDYHYREATQEFRGTGYVIEATGSTATLWSEQGGWQYLDGSPASSKTVLEVIPVHTGQTYELVRQGFVGVSADSFHALLTDQIIYHLHLTGNEILEAVYEAKGGRETVRQTKFDLDHVASLQLREIETAKASQAIAYRVNPRITTLQAKAKRLRREQARRSETRRSHYNRVVDLEAQLDTARDIYRRTLLLQELEDLQKREERPDNIEEELRDVTLQLQELVAQDQQEHEARLAMAAEKQSTREVPLRLSGVITFVRFSGDASGRK